MARWGICGMAFRRKITLTGEGLIYLFVPAIVLTGAILREINLLVLLGGFLVWPLLFSYSTASGATRRIRFHRRLPAGVSAGDTFTVDLTIENQRRWGTSRAFALVDSIWREDRRRWNLFLRPSVLVSQIRPQDRTTVSYRGKLTRRGRYRFGPLRAVTEYPLGFIRASVTSDQLDTFIVGPKLGRLTESWAKLHRDELFGNRSTRRRSATVEGDFFGLRDWQSGDSRRWIHWRTTARRGTLAVRQFEQPQHQDLAILLNLWQPRQADAAAIEYAELAVSFVATIVSDLCGRTSSHILLGVAGTDIVLSRGSASKAFLADAMEMLAVATPSEVDRGSELLARAGSEIRQGMRIAFVSTCPIVREALRQATARGDNFLQVRAADMIHLDVSRDDLSRFFQVA